LRLFCDEAADVFGDGGSCRSLVCSKSSSSLTSTNFTIKFSTNIDAPWLRFLWDSKNSSEDGKRCLECLRGLKCFSALTDGCTAAASCAYAAAASAIVSVDGTEAADNCSTTLFLDSCEEDPEPIGRILYSRERRFSLGGCCIARAFAAAKD
jgi:hypothetical protein